MPGVTYSVWDEDRQRYDYYRVPGKLRAGVIAPPPKHLRATLGASKLGVTPEQAARPLPPGAKKIGSGPLPKGMIASRGGMRALGAVFGIDEKFLWLGAGAAGAYLWMRSK